jgi:3-hydroxybutyryl-CoA dehydrogenase
MAKTLEPAIADAWMVLEAVQEQLDLKKTIFADLDRLAPKDATITCTLSDNVLGMPVHLMGVVVSLF